MFKVFRVILDGDEKVYLVSRDTREEAETFLAEFGDLWPGDYVIEASNDD